MHESSLGVILWSCFQDLIGTECFIPQLDEKEKGFLKDPSVTWLLFFTQLDYTRRLDRHIIRSSTKWSLCHNNQHNSPRYLQCVHTSTKYQHTSTYLSLGAYQNHPILSLLIFTRPWLPQPSKTLLERGGFLLGRLQNHVQYIHW